MTSGPRRRLRLDAVQEGRALATAEPEPDEKDALEKRDLEAERKALRLANEHLFLGLRQHYGTNIIRFLWAYSAVALGLILLDGYAIFGFDIPNAAIVALISGAAVSVLGVVGTVAAGLFKPPPE